MQPHEEASPALEIRRLREQNAQLEKDVEQLTAMLRYLQKSRFAASSERYVSPEQPMLIHEESEAKQAEALSPDDDTQPTEVEDKKRRKKKRPVIPAHLPRHVIKHDVPEDERVCPHHAVPLEKSGERRSEQLEWSPAKIHVIEHVCATYNCPVCDGEAKAAEPPPAPIPGSVASPSLLAHIATAKYADALPLYRQEAILARHGIQLTRTTMATWMGRLAQMLMPLYNLMNETLLASPVVYIDETHLQVLKVEGKAATSKSYLWVRVGADEAGHKIVLFHFDPSRGSQVAKTLLSGYEGFVMTDGYDGYNAVEALPGIRRLQCWMHVRRHFKKALDILGAPAKGGITEQGLQKIQDLYRIEREAAEMTPAERHAHRLKHAKPLLEAFRPWLEEALLDLPPKGVAAQAVRYALERWSYLEVFLEDGRLEIDNRLAENAVRPVAVGRKNWLFSDSVSGAEASAVIYSIIETVKANGAEPFAYLQRVIERMVSAISLADVEALLPWASVKQ